jgi:sulfate transport system substrate-binding protein
VTLVDAVIEKKGTRATAQAYLNYWYTKDGQEIAARNFYRPRDPEIATKYESAFAKVDLFTIDDVFGGWTRAQKEHFAEGGIFDQIYKN